MAGFSWERDTTLSSGQPPLGLDAPSIGNRAPRVDIGNHQSNPYNKDDHYYQDELNQCRAILIHTFTPFLLGLKQKPDCHSKSKSRQPGSDGSRYNFGNPAVSQFCCSRRPVAFRPRLTTGLAFSTCIFTVDQQISKDCATCSFKP